MDKQDVILRQLAKDYGINIGQAEEIWRLFINKIHLEISDTNKRTEGIYDINKFPLIHIENFGKFIPSKKKVDFVNSRFERKQLKKNTDD
tara:strand:- start:110 stop:379 length:270 start_codon:yes stop_codon:yes gene_type:complete